MLRKKIRRKESCEEIEMKEVAFRTDEKNRSEAELNKQKDCSEDE